MFQNRDGLVWDAPFPLDLFRIRVYFSSGLLGNLVFGQLKTAEKCARSDASKNRV